MTEEKKTLNNQTEISRLRERFEKFLLNDFAHVARDVSHIKGEMVGIRQSMDLISRTAGKALDTAMKRYPVWVTFLLTASSSLVVGLVVWILSNKWQ